MKTNFKKVWSVTWKTLVCVVLVFIGLICISELCDRFEMWRYRYVNHQTYGVSTYYMPDETAFVVKHDYENYYRTYDANTGKALTPKLGYIYTGKVTDTLTVYRDMKDRRGFLNAYTGKIAISAKWDKAWIFSEGLGAVVEHNRLGFIDHQGNWVIEPRYLLSYDDLEYVFKHGLCTVKDTCGLFGLIDHEGNFVLRPEYTYIQRYENGLRMLNKDDKQGLYCDSLRQIVLDCEYDNITFSDEGITLTRSGRKWMVSHDLKSVIYPCLFDYQSTFTVYLDEEDEYGNRKHYEYEPIGYYKVNYRTGLLDRRTGLPITPAIYSDIQFVTPNLFDCELAGGYSDDHIFINAKGERVQ